ncbi:MAG: SRPBCC family protein [Actinobacteria bacterium]|nr:SRPBCC family protein [Actinomycetota bacterium]
MTTQDTIEISAPAGDRVIDTGKTFDAPPARVFRAYVDPEQIPKWWGPAYLTTTIDALEPHHGGRWHFVQTDPDGNVHGFRGVFHDVIDDERITWTFEYEGAPGHISLESISFEPTADGGTRVSTHAVFQTVEARDAMMTAGAESGMREGYERLEALLSDG